MEENFSEIKNNDKNINIDSNKKLKSTFISLIEIVKNYVKNNVLFLGFVFLMLFNSTLLRCFTVKNYFSIKPLLADIAVVLIIGGIGYAIRPRRRFAYYLVWLCVFSLLSAGNSIYYTNYRSYVSVSLISTASQLGGVMDAVTKNILELKDLTFLLSILIYIGLYIYLKRKKKYFDRFGEKTVKKKKYILSTVLTGVAFMAIFATQLTGTDVSRLSNSWNREYVLSAFGLYTYTFSDIVTSTNAQLNVYFGEEDSQKAFNAFYDTKNTSDPVSDENEYTDIFKGKNMLVIHAESIQQFLLDTKINGEELTPNLNKLAKEGIYFSNFYAQESVGTSADSEFTFSTSLMPAASGTVAINYTDREYVSTQKLLKQLGYYTFSMHANNGSYWNRMNLHKSLGYDKFFNYITDYTIKESDIVGLGLNDKSFFKQSVVKINQIAKEHDNFMGTLIMLTNHTPFSDINKVSDFDVSFKYQKYNELTGKYEEASAPFLTDTKMGNYFKSVHYADEALGELIQELDDSKLLDNTVIVLYGDHDAKIKESEYDYYINYDPYTGTVLTEGDEGYVPINEYAYNLNRKVPFIIWTKDHKEYTPTEVKTVGGMYDALPTLGNMFGYEDEYALGHDLFSEYAKDNILILPSGNYITNKIYYSSSKEEYFNLTNYTNYATSLPCNQVYSYSDGLPKLKDDTGFLTKNRLKYSEENLTKRVNDEVVDANYITDRSNYAETRINISNAIIFHDMIKKNTDTSNITSTEDYGKITNSTTSSTNSATEATNNKAA